MSTPTSSDAGSDSENEVEMNLPIILCLASKEDFSLCPKIFRKILMGE